MGSNKTPIGGKTAVPTEHNIFCPFNIPSILTCVGRNIFSVKSAKITVSTTKNFYITGVCQHEVYLYKHTSTIFNISVLSSTQPFSIHLVKIFCKPAT